MMKLSAKDPAQLQASPLSVGAGLKGGRPIVVTLKTPITIGALRISSIVVQPLKRADAIALGRGFDDPADDFTAQLRLAERVLAMTSSLPSKIIRQLPLSEMPDLLAAVNAQVVAAVMAARQQKGFRQ